MGFLAPISFWFLSAIPVLLLFYFFKKQYDKETISSIYLWERTFQEWESDHWWKRLQKNLLLLLQLLILLFLIVALTRPYLEDERLTGDHLVLVLDTSATMTTEQSGKTRLAAAKEQAKNLIERLGSRHKVSVIHAKKDPVLLTTHQTNHDAARDLIEKLQISYQHENLDDSVQLAASLIQQEDGEVHVFTDNMKKENLEEEQFSNPIIVHNAEAAPPNLSLQTFGVKEDSNQVSAIATVENESSEEMEVTLTISHNGEQLKQLRETIQANEQQTIRLEQLPIHDYYQAEIESDAYPLDNVLHALLPEQHSPSIYLAGEVNPFIEQALLSAGYQLTTVTKDENGNYSFPELQPEVIYLLSGVKAEQWPEGPKLIISPSAGGPFEVREKKELDYRLTQTDDAPMLTYTDVSNVYLEQAFPVGNWQGLKPLVQSGDQTVIAKGMFREDPMIFFAFDFTHSDWPLHPGFPVLLANSIAELADKEGSLGYYSPGETTEINLAATTNEAVIEQLDGGERQQVDIGLSEVTMPEKPGIYRLQEKTDSGSRYRYFAVQLDSEERTSETAASFALKGQGEEEKKTQLSKQEIWRIFAAIALLILFIEWEVYRRGITSR